MQHTNGEDWDHEWDPMMEDYHNPEFNSYVSGPGAYMENVIPMTAEASRGSGGVGHRKGVDVGCRVYVAGVPHDLTEDGLVNLFSECGRVKGVYKNKNNDMTSPSTYAFVTYYNPLDAGRACEDFQHRPIANCVLRARMAFTPEQKIAAQQRKMAALDNASAVAATAGPSNFHEFGQNEQKSQIFPQSQKIPEMPRGRAAILRGYREELRQSGSAHIKKTPLLKNEPSKKPVINTENSAVNLANRLLVRDRSDSNRSETSGAGHQAAAEGTTHVNGFHSYVHSGGDATPMPMGGPPATNASAGVVGGAKTMPFKSMGGGEDAMDEYARCRMPGMCQNCKKSADLKCRVCKTSYCSMECQKIDWEKHKHYCNYIKHNYVDEVDKAAPLPRAPSVESNISSVQTPTLRPTTPFEATPALRRPPSCGAGIGLQLHNAIMNSNELKTSDTARHRTRNSSGQSDRSVLNSVQQPTASCQNSDNDRTSLASDNPSQKVPEVLMRDRLPFPELHTNEWIAAYSKYSVTPLRFFMQPLVKTGRNAYKQMATDMNRFGELMANRGLLKTCDLVVDQLILYQERNEWKRGFVVKMDGGDFLAVHVDSGFCCKLAGEEVLPMIKDFILLPPMVICCRLDVDVTLPMPDALKREFCSLLRRRVTYRLKILEIIDNVYTVELMTDDGTNVSERLLSLGMATKRVVRQPSSGLATQMRPAHGQDKAQRRQVQARELIPIADNLTVGSDVVINILNRLEKLPSFSATVMTPQFRELMNRINSSNLPNLEREAIGDLIVAQFEDSRWYRAEVVGIQQDHMSVRYVDYGNTENINRRQLRSLPHDLGDKNYYLATVTLEIDSSKPEKAYLQAANEMLSKTDGEVKVRVIGKRNDCLVVDFIDRDWQARKAAILSRPPAPPSATELLTIGGQVKIVVEGEFDAEGFVSMILDPETLEKVEALQKEYNNPAEAIRALTEGEHVMGLYASVWCRARVEKASKLSATLFYVDYGNTEHNVVFMRIQKLMPKHLNVPILACRMHLAGVQHPMSNDARCVFREFAARELAKDECLCVKIMGIGDDEHGTSVQILGSKGEMLHKKLQGLVSKYPPSPHIHENGFGPSSGGGSPDCAVAGAGSPGFLVAGGGNSAQKTDFSRTKRNYDGNDQNGNYPPRNSGAKSKNSPSNVPNGSTNQHDRRDNFDRQPKFRPKQCNSKSYPKNDEHKSIQQKNDFLGKRCAGSERKMQRTFSVSSSKQKQIPQQLSFAVGERLTVVVEGPMNPASFVALVIRDTTIRAQKLTESFNGVDVPHELSVGEYVMARYEGEWARARVDAGARGALELFYIDFGNRSPPPPLDDIRLLDDDELATLPVSAYEFKFQNAPHDRRQQDEFAKRADQLFSAQCRLVEVEIVATDRTVKVVDHLKEQFDQLFAELVPSSASAMNAHRPIGRMEFCVQTPGIKVNVMVHDLKSVDYFVGVVVDQQLVEIEEAMTKIYDGCQNTAPAYRPDIDEYVAALYNNSWHRGRVLALGENGATVWFCDIGETGRTSYSNVKRLESSMYDYPYYASPMALSLPGRSSNDIDKAFQGLLRKRDHMCTFVVKEIVSDERIIVEFADDFVDNRAQVTAASVDVPLARVSCILDEKAAGTEVMIKMEEVLSATEYIGIVLDKRFLALGEMMTSYEDAMDFHRPTVGEFVACRYQDGNWYRALVTSVNGDVVDVWYADYTNKETTSVANVRRLRAEHTALPHFAANLRLSGVESSGLPTSARAKMEALVAERNGQFTVKVGQREQNGSYVIEFEPEIQRLITSWSLVAATRGLPTIVSDLSVGTRIICVPIEIRAVNDLRVIVISPVDPEYKEIFTRLSERYNESSADPDFRPVVDDLVVTYKKDSKPDDRLWVRGRVLEVHGDGSYTVDIFDFAQITRLTAADIRALSPDFLNAKIMCVSTKLSGLTYLLPDNDDILEAMNAALAQIVGSTLEGTVLEVGEQTMTIDLPDFNRILIEAKVAYEGALDMNVFRGNDFALASMKFASSDWTPGSEHQVIISQFNSPDDYYAQPLDLVEGVTQLLVEMSDYYGRLPPNQDYFLPNVGAIIAAKFSEDNQYYRAQVRSIQQHSVHVFYVDFGNSEQVCLLDLYPLAERFAELPLCAVLCRLPGVAPTGDRWESRALAVCSECTAVEDGPRTLKVVDRVNNLILADISLKNGKWMKNSLLEMHFARVETTFLKKAKAKDLQTRSLVVGQEADGTISWVQSPGEFYVQLQQHEADIVDMDKKIQAICDVAGVPAEAGIGDLVLAKWQNHWFRAAVVRQNVDKFYVDFIDYGNSDQVSPEEIYAIPSELVAVPKLAIACELNGADLPRTFTKEVQDEFFALACNKRCRIRGQGFGRNQNAMVSLTIDGVLVDDLVRQLVFKATVPEVVLPPLVEAKMRRKVMFTDLEAPTPVHGKHVGMVVHAENPHDFYCVTLDDAEMSKAVEERLANVKPVMLTEQPSKGEVLIANFQGTWCRAVIQCVNNDVVSIKYIDYGNEEKIAWNQCAELPSSVMEFAPIARQTKLYGASPSNGSWSRGVQKAFFALVVNKITSMDFLRRDQGIHLVKLEMNDLGDVGVWLVDSGFAQGETLENAA